MSADPHNVAAIMAELRKLPQAREVPALDLPVTREDAEMARAEDRAGQRRAEALDTR